jgi:1-acyl-sn-glycerol-3-phosphate acyltransferase
MVFMPPVTDLSAHSLTDLYAAKRVLLIGGTGFLGSVTLSMLMWRLPALERLYVLVRKSPGLDAQRRFMERVLPGAAFDPVRAHLGEDFDRLVADKLEVVQGDLTQRDVGLAPEVLARLTGALDLILNASGLVDFHAPLDLAHRTNVRGTLHLIGLARDTGAALVHTSTCYVAGSRDGHVAEDVVVGRFPRQEDAPYLTFDAGHEDEDIAAEIALVKAQLDTRPAQARLAEQAVARYRAANGCDPTAAQLANAVKRAQRDQLSVDLVDAGRRRAAAWGWPNVYTYTKSIAEQLLACSGVRHAIVRPAIIESAMSYPLEGWNQNATTSAPLVMLALAGFDQVPARKEHVLDVIPVDMVAWSLLAVGGATMANAHQPVYQVGTSDANPVSMGRVTDLLGLYIHTKELAKGPRKEDLKRLWKANREPRLVDAPAFRRKAALVTKSAEWLSERAKHLGEGVIDSRAKGWLERLGDKADATTAELEKARGLWNVFMPFSHDHDYRFASGHTQALAAAIVPGDGPGAFAPELINWRVYWLEVHVPGLEKWVLTEGTSGGAIKALPTTAGLLERVEGVARRDPHRQALALLAGDRPSGLTYAQLWQATGRLATQLSALDLPQDLPIAIHTDSLGAWPIALIATWRSGRAALITRSRLPIAEGSAALLQVPDVATCLLTRTTGETIRLKLEEAAQPFTGPNGHGPATVGSTGPQGQAPQNAGPQAPVLQAEGPQAQAPKTGLPETSPVARVAFCNEHGPGPFLEARNLAERLATLGTELGIEEGNTVLLAMPAGDDRETDAFALVLLATLYQQACADLIAASHWAEALEYSAPNVVALGSAGWEAAPETYGLGALAHVAQVVDLSPACPDARRKPFWNQGARVLQPLIDGRGSAVIALRALEAASDEDSPFLAVPPWRLRATQGRLEVAPATSEDWQACDWSATQLESGGFRLEGSGRPGPGGRAEALLRRPRKLLELAVRPPVQGENGLRAVAVPDLKSSESIQAVRRHLLDETWRYNQNAAFTERLLFVGLTLVAGTEPAIWLDTRHKPRHDEPHDLESLREDTLALVAGRLNATNLAFFTERLDGGTLTYERLASWERVLVRAINTGDMTAQGFLQAFEHELARTRTPAYKAAMLFGRALGKIGNWAADEQPETRLLPEPITEAVRKGLGAAAMAFYRHGLAVTVKGAAYVPAGENFLVVANHSSHLDGGLVKYALGAWGDRLYTLAAKDYFFGTPSRRFVSHHFTRLVPTDRHKVGTEWLRRAKEILLNGDCVLIFPEGTRQAGPDVGAFKASLGTLARQAEVTILPVRVVGTDEVLPKGAALPRGRKVTVFVGPPIPYEVLRARTAELGSLAQDRAIAALIQEAVEGLPEGRYWWLDGWRERHVPALPAAVEVEVLP